MLDELHQEILQCQRCELYRSRTNVVPGEGNKKTKVFFVGEAPGEQEDIQGRPFVGQAGKLLTQLLSIISLSRSDVFIGNVLKCRPPLNRDPLPSEIETCKAYLIAQIAIIKPKIICPLGNFALKALLRKDLSISKAHGKIFRKNEILYLPMYHPAALLHQSSASLKQALREDMRKLGRILEQPDLAE